MILVPVFSEFKDVMPRFQLIQDWEVIQDDKEIISAVLDASFDPRRKVDDKGEELSERIRSPLAPLLLEPRDPFLPLGRVAQREKADTPAA